MGDLIFKTSKWFLFMAFFIGGLGFLMLSISISVNFSFASLLCFGAMYMLTGMWKDDMESNDIVVTVILLGITFTIAYFLVEIVYILKGDIIEHHLFFSWIGIMFFIGCPTMFIKFKFFD